MPTVNVTITRAWRHANEEGRIHYTIQRSGGMVRHLFCIRGTALYDVLESHLAAQGYTGPKSEQQQVTT